MSVICSARRESIEKNMSNVNPTNTEDSKYWTELITASTAT